MQNVTFFGAGYVGLTTAAHVAGTHKVVVYDPDEVKRTAIEAVLEGDTDHLYIHEAGLVELLRKNKRNIHPTSTLDEALEKPELIILAVGTPSIPETGHANLKYLVEAAQAIGSHLLHDAVVLVKSTVPPGTSSMLDDVLFEQLGIAGSPARVAVGACPEFLAEGTAMADLRTPYRVVVGLDDPQAQREVHRFFRTMYGEGTILMTDVASAELSKHASNAMLATRITFVNDLARLCEAVGADIKAVTRAMGMDPRIGSKFLNAGFGYGGSCFPKDTRALATFARGLHVPLPIVEAAIAGNEVATERFTQNILASYNGDLTGEQFVLWGVGFKAGTDDLRDSRAVEVMRTLLERGATVHVYDPVAGARRNLEEDFESALGHHLFTYDSQYGMAPLVDHPSIIIGNEDNQFRSVDVAPFGSVRTVFDGKNVLSAEEVLALQEAGVQYHGVGRGTLTGSASRPDLVAYLRHHYMDG
ncbi:MAG: UDP-glucose/GDP-mannose dehydrogenase family protein [Candidatus Woesearchaeota archaeon]|nr:MAG: UDP-glucose/GDP-mannose dehydrogenase family protein [Candidatus Woesearchaeota archaeon]